MSALSLTADAIPCLCNLLDPPPTGYCPVLQVLNVTKIKRIEATGSFLYATDSGSCGTCNGKPCDWTKYGADIVGFVTQICEAEELKHNHKNKRLLSFSGYSAWKHRYLGRNNRVKVPLCVEVGIQSSYV